MCSTSCRCSGRPEPAGRRRLVPPGAQQAEGAVWAEPHQLGLLGIDRVTELQESLELIVLGEGDDLHDCSELGENLKRTKTNLVR